MRPVPKRRSRSSRLLPPLGGLLLGSLALTNGADAQLRPAPAPPPPVRPTAAAPAAAVRTIDASRLRPLPNPQKTAEAMGALIRFANGVAPVTSVDKLIAQELGKIRNGRAIAKRMVAPFEQLPSASRARALPGVDVAAIGTRPADPKANAGLMTTAGVPVATTKSGASVSPGEELPAESSSTTKAYEISYAGLRCNTPANPAGDKTAVLAAWVTHKANEPYVVHEKLFPSSGTLPSLTAGASTNASAGVLYTGSELGYDNWGYADKGAVLIEAVLIDEGGDIATQKEEIDLLITLAQTFATTIPGSDRLGALKTAIDYHAGLLHLSNPTKWSANPIAARIVTLNEYNSWFNASATTANGITSKFSLDTAPKTSSYSVFFSTPTYQDSITPVTVTVTQVTSNGSIHDSENGLADLVLGLDIGGAYTQKTLAKDKNSHTLGWKVFRKMLKGQKVPIVLTLDEKDPPPPGAVVTGSWGACHTYCGPEPSIPSCLYTGPCSDIYNDVDISPKGDEVTQSGWGWSATSTAVLHKNLQIVYDMTTGAITGDVTGTKGAPITATGNDTSRRASITFKVE